MKPLSVLLVEDHHLIREALRALLEEQGSVTVVGQARDGLEALSMTASLHPDIVIMDIGMPNLNGLEATRRLCELPNAPQIVILSQYSRQEYVVQALLAGARAYLLKDAVADELSEAIDRVVAGEMYLTRQFSPMQREEIEDYIRLGKNLPNPLQRLTPREHEVLQLVAEGHTNRQIAVKLSISVKTWRSTAST